MIRIYFNLLNGYLDGYGSTPSGTPGELSLEVPENHEVLKIPEVFKYENGELIKDSVYQQEQISIENNEKKRPTDEEMNAIAIMELAQMIMGGK